jgi:hypothetical protein
MPTFNYTVDDEQQSTNLHEMTPVQILSQAHIDTNSHYLVEIRGKNKISYENKPNELIHMHQNMKFISISTGPTPV